MTQPQDKMRAEFEAWASQRNLISISNGFRSEWSGLPLLWDAWHAACAQQSAQASQDALDAARYRFLRDVPMEEWGDELESVIRLQKNAKFDSTIDAAIAAQGASNV